MHLEIQPNLGILQYSIPFLGIWYAGDPVEKKLWIANSNTPILNSSGLLTLDSTELTGSLVARLQDSGNFVVQDETRNKTLWQSYSSDTNVTFKKATNYQTLSKQIYKMTNRKLNGRMCFL
ncbi:hypothetical protein FXO38_05847 [Capsicum annuum]|nr:hypothetical protein FXO38_05847 [Capsicum annuum]KAF3675644.1 hypothetical protein FXO37_05736 [Capsicum annuum]